MISQQPTIQQSTLNSQQGAKADETCQPNKKAQQAKYQFFGQICPPARHLHFMYACWAVLMTKRPNDQTTKRPNDQIAMNCTTHVGPGVQAPGLKGGSRQKKSADALLSFWQLG
jgi:hypothetical protein